MTIILFLAAGFVIFAFMFNNNDWHDHDFYRYPQHGYQNYPPQPSAYYPPPMPYDYRRDRDDYNGTRIKATVVFLILLVFSMWYYDKKASDTVQPTRTKYVPRSERQKGVSPEQHAPDCPCKCNCANEI